MSTEQVHNLIIGSGVAGKIIAWTLASQGQKTVVVERSMVGGSCPNVACLPSKNVIYSAKAVSLVHPTQGLGVVTGPVRVVWTHPTAAEGSLGLFASPPSAPGRVQSFSSSSVNSSREPGALPATAKE